MVKRKSLIMVIGLVFVSLMLVGSIGIESKNLEVSESVIESDENKQDNSLVIIDLRPVDYKKGESVSVLKNRVDNYQSSVISRYKNTSGVKVIDSWWITNAIMIKVNFSTVGVNSLYKKSNKIESMRSNNNLTIPKPIGGSEKNSNSDISSERLLGKDKKDYSKGMRQMNIIGVRDKFGFKGRNSRVTVLDTGVNTNISQISLANSNPWKDFIGNSPEPIDSDIPFVPAHGTQVSALINAESIDGVKVGIAPEANLAVGRVCGENGCPLSDVLSGIEWAVNTNSDVVSTSLGGKGTNDLYENAIRNAFKSGVVFVASSGNFGDDTSAAPANSYDVIGVGSTNEDRTISEFSSGDLIISENVADNIPSRWPSEYVQPDVVAPGKRVRTLSGKTEKRTISSGTSFSAPQVSGLVALMIQSRPGNNNVSEIKRVLRQTADKPEFWDSGTASHSLRGTDSRYGKGIPDAVEAVRVYSENGKTISGYIEDTKGNRVSGARVSQVGRNVSTLTNENGMYKITLGGGNTSLKVDAFGFEEKIKSTKERNSINFELESKSDAKKIGLNLNKIEPREKLTKLYQTENVQKVSYSSNSKDNLSVRINGKKVKQEEKVSVNGFTKIDIKLDINDKVLSDEKTVSVDVLFTGEGSKEITETVRFSETVRNVLVINDNRISNPSMSRFVKKLKGLEYNVYSSNLDSLVMGKRHETIILHSVENFNIDKVKKLKKADVLIATEHFRTSNGIKYLAQKDGSPNSVDKGLFLKDESIGYDINKKHPIFGNRQRTEIHESHTNSAATVLTYGVFNADENYNVLAQATLSDGTNVGDGVAVHEEKDIILLSNFGFFKNSPIENYKKGSRDILKSVITTFSDDNNFDRKIVDRFEDSPRNTEELDPVLYEDLDGDNNGIETSQTVKVFGKLIRDKSLNMTERQAKLLNWARTSPSDKVTTEDMVALYGEQIRHSK